MLHLVRFQSLVAVAFILSPSRSSFSRVYNNQHWVIQEAEQRRIAESRSSTKPASASPAASSPASSLHSQPSPSPVYENLNSKQTVRPTQQATAYHSQALPRPEADPNSWQTPPQPPRLSNAYPQENLYANLGSVPPPQASYDSSSALFQR